MTIGANYTSWQQALLNWATASTGLLWVWENEPRPHILAAPAYGILSGPTEIPQIGRDWVAYDRTDPTKAIPVPTGVRTMDVSARIISRDQTAASKAGTYLEMARMYLAFPQTKDAWNLVGMSLAGTGSIRIFDAPGQDERVESVAALTLTLNITPDALLGGVDVGVIDRIAVTSALSPLSTPPNVVQITLGSAADADKDVP